MKRIFVILAFVFFMAAFAFADVAYPAGNNPGDVLTGLGTLFF